MEMCTYIIRDVFNLLRERWRKGNAMKRYGVWADHHVAQMKPEVKGDWVRYTDAQAAVEALQAQYSELLEALDCVLAERPLPSGEYVHRVSCNGDRRKPAGTIGISCSCRVRQRQVEALQRERDALEAKCLEEHVTIEQADAKVMKLEGEKGMWASERIDLLTQLENAEFALDAERAELLKVRATCDMLGKERNEADEAKYHAELKLTQFQALVRAYCEAKVAFDDGRLREDHHAWKERFERLTTAEQALIATLDATTPATTKT